MYDDYYVGEFRNDDRHGRGVMIYQSVLNNDDNYNNLNKSTQSHMSQTGSYIEKYDGEWSDNKSRTIKIFFISHPLIKIIE